MRERIREAFDRVHAEQERKDRTLAFLAERTQGFTDRRRALSFPRQLAAAVLDGIDVPAEDPADLRGGVALVVVQVHHVPILLGQGEHSLPPAFAPAAARAMVTAVEGDTAGNKTAAGVEICPQCQRRFSCTPYRAAARYRRTAGWPCSPLARSASLHQPPFCYRLYPLPQP